MQCLKVCACLACLKDSMETSVGQREQVGVEVKEVQGRRVGQRSCWALWVTVRTWFLLRERWEVMGELEQRKDTI